ncbi:hypothetical protein PAHAL_6G237800 [Panicum hallii]|uniref:PWWP domain-containing protein n=1 Tax=Panicum hallii TaxID=206008 RepID=A0A2T8IHB5_9POAL|nr:DNA mismatch repair protein Msh6-like isoform X2 [Panicum hallii]PVH37078.1 hypothetical protein PAHAL_6G237800 [Panicum hallii]PVH37079.1 hypothetical protein PAHAL_6G237800 [Panicum hallii]
MHPLQSCLVVIGRLLLLCRRPPPTPTPHSSTGTSSAWWSGDPSGLKADFVCWFALIIMVNENAEKDDGIDESPSASQVPENKSRHNFRLGDITWVKLGGSSWWPAQVIDESCVGSKPKKKDKYDCLVRLYGTCQYFYIDPWKSNSEFEMMLKQENKSAMEAFHEVLEKELSCVNSPSDCDEEVVNSKGGSTKVTSKKNSSRKVRKQEGLKPQYNEGEEDDQDVGSTETTGVTARKKKGGRVRQPSSIHDTIDKASSEISAEGLRNKRQKNAAQSASVGSREVLRRSARSDAKQYLVAAEENTEPLTDIHGTEDSLLYETPAPHTEIKAMVRDILFKDIIDREHDADMAYVDEVINGICSATDDIISGGAAASTKGGRGAKLSGSGVEGESSNVRQRHRDEASEDALHTTSPETMKGNTDTTHGSSGEDTGAT